MLQQILDRLRGVFLYAIAAVLPLAGVILAGVRYSEGERDEALRIALASLLGIFVYALVFLA